MTSNVVVCIQARTNSSRLPGKVLLPISGIPLSVLAAKRASRNSSFDVQVLTSEEKSDDLLARTLAQHGITCFRGELDNVLKRFVDALSCMPDSTIVVRLTADNVFPDSDFIKDIVADFESKGLEYICANGEESFLPYGLSAEVTRVEFLREALAATNEPYELEHVTPYIQKKYGRTFFKSKNLPEDIARLRCTVDNLDDYLQVAEIFNQCDNPTNVSVTTLCNILQDKQYVGSKTKLMVLGCAQLGLEYGINNVVGKPDRNVSHKLLSTAVRSGIQYLDTARGYGDSEKVIGSWLSQGWSGRCQVITKLDPLGELKCDSDIELVKTLVEDSVNKSCQSLGVSCLDVLMLHRAEHLFINEGAVYQKLISMKQQGVIHSLGVSVQNPKELKMALACKAVSFIQLPYNILDWRWELVVDEVVKAKSERELVIHTRSALLQGLLTTKAPDLWKRAHVANNANIVKWLEEQTTYYGFDSVSALCIAHVASLGWVDGIVIGCETEKQIYSNIQAINFLASEKDVPLSKLKCPLHFEEKTLNPALWSN
ncbi:aldo/keto reductase [Vibrio gigantis]|uniref:aldo/keto reductase n=1 Tax=Vibrio gigantis TaxID=296199 RepID=UPI001BFD3199|nr:aldo/keto reductase [Vibrio gigantis]